MRQSISNHPHAPVEGGMDPVGRWLFPVILGVVLVAGPAPAGDMAHMPDDPSTVENAPPPERMIVRPKREKKTPPDTSTIPFDKIEGPHRDRVIEILQKPVSWHAGRREMFPCHEKLLHWLIDHPDTVCEYWKQLGIFVTDVEPIEGGYLCRDQAGATVHFYVACSEPNLRICYCIGEAPAGIIPFKMRAELVIVHRYQFQEFTGAGTYVVQQLDGFASATGPTLKLAMKLAPGHAEHMVNTCVQEMKLFFSVMCRLMQVRPEWSKEKWPAVAHTVPAPERPEIEAILGSLPSKSTASFLQRNPEAATQLAIDPDAVQPK
jgi:hypothetical protein